MNLNNSSRRKFIKRTGAVAGVSIIPSKSVWGACNSSGVSGGSKDTSETCSVGFTEFGGRSGGSWDKFLEEANPNTINSNYSLDERDDQGLKKIHGMFSNYSNHKWNELEPKDNDEPWVIDEKRRKIQDIKRLYDDINDVIVNTPDIDLGGSEGGEIPAATLDLSEALQGGGIAKQLACVYMNLHFGFIQRPTSFLTNQQYMEHLWGVHHKGNVSLETTIDSRWEQLGTGTSSYISSYNT
ncbi:hypothetical protein [Alteromonas lipolytica]|uniref:hypothetical protein n=1 Tax=Alteromonas lipolytica TaxID=1856405 RepID=UPI0011130DB3|nr:hypothetical protein [Alteromonas lipolytica]GGF65557.1 hypothetical protein GCM10011338_17390 [Alteromonas lipolytica]